MIVFGKSLNREQLKSLAIVVNFTGLEHVSLLELLHRLIFLRKLIGFLEIVRYLRGQTTDIIQYLAITILNLPLKQFLLHIVIHEVLCLGDHNLLKHL